MWSIVVAMLGSLRSALRARRSLVLENLALRQQLALLRQRSRRPRFGRFDQLFWVHLSRRWSRWHDVLHLVRPETVIRWHREGFRAFDVEITTRANGSAAGQLGGCRARPHYGAGKPSLGRTTHPWRVAQARVRHLAADCCPSHAPSSEAAL